MRIRIFETLDITERVIDLSAESATWNNLDGLIAPVRTVTLHNYDGLYSPDAVAGVFSDSAYRNQFLEIFDDADNLLFKGLIKGVTEQITERGQSTVTIRAMDAIGSFLDWPVQAAASITGISTNLASTAGQNTVRVPNTVPIPVDAVVSTSAAYVPAYRVTAVTPGGGNLTLTLDRGLETAVASGTPLFISVPSTVTIPRALKDAFTTPLAYYGLTSLIGSSFDSLDAQEQAAGRLIRLFVRREEEIDLRSHIGKLLELGGYYLTRSADGVFELVDGLAYDGEALLEEITDSEIIGPVESIDDESRLLFGFSLLYAASNEVRKVEYDLELGYGVGEVPQYEPGLNAALIEKYGATKVFKPIAAKSATLAGYNYLYNSRATAVYYGLKALNYAAYGRVQYKFGLKPFISGDPNKSINLTFFKKLLLTMKVNDSESYTREPAIVLAYEKNKDTGEYTGVVVELTNRPTPNLPVP